LTPRWRWPVYELTLFPQGVCPRPHPHLHTREVGGHLPLQSLVPILVPPAPCGEAVIGGWSFLDDDRHGPWSGVFVNLTFGNFYRDGKAKND
jgi:hypothetical protein